MNDREVMKMALEALELEATSPPIAETAAALAALRAALAEPDDVAAAVEAEREKCERLKHAMREAMHLLDQPEPRPHAAFSELLLALNPKLDNRARERK